MPFHPASALIRGETLQAKGLSKAIRAALAIDHQLKHLCVLRRFCGGASLGPQALACRIAHHLVFECGGGFTRHRSSVPPISWKFDNTKRLLALPSALRSLHGVLQVSASRHLEISEQAALGRIELSRPLSVIEDRICNGIVNQVRVGHVREAGAQACCEGVENRLGQVRRCGGVAINEATVNLLEEMRIRTWQAS